jgi:hypothetical protein
LISLENHHQNQLVGCCFTTFDPSSVGSLPSVERAERHVDIEWLVREIGVNGTQQLQMSSQRLKVAMMTQHNHWPDSVAEKSTNSKSSMADR